MTDRIHAARTSVGVVFFLNGLLFACLVSRIPDLRAGLDLSNTGLGLLLLTNAVGSLIALPATGALVARFGSAAVVGSGSVLCSVGFTLVGVGAAAGEVTIVAVGLPLYGLATGAWDVAMNVEGAEVERRLGRTIMPRFHAGFSLGTVAGALLGVLVVAVRLPVLVHLTLAAVVAATVVVVAVRRFLPVEADHHDRTPARTAWLEPRVLLIGLVVLAFAVAEGSANDWLALALVDGHDTPRWMGVAGFATFVVAMTCGRLLGTRALDRFGRVATLRATAVVAGAGLLLLVLGTGPLVVVGVLMWGLGASLGFPVGMSAAADDPRRAAARVAVVSTIGYAAFLTGPPLLGALGDEVGTLRALLAVAVLLVPATLALPAVREQRSAQSAR
jgi:fucose permease